MYLNTYDIIFLAVTASGLIALGIYDYTKARSKNFVNTFQKHYQDQINECQGKSAFFSPKTSTPGKRQGLSIVLTYFLIFCLGTIPVWIYFLLFSREFSWFGRLIPYGQSLIVMGAAIKSTRFKGRFISPGSPSASNNNSQFISRRYNGLEAEQHKSIHIDPLVHNPVNIGSPHEWYDW